MDAYVKLYTFNLSLAMHGWDAPHQNRLISCIFHVFLCSDIGGLLYVCVRNNCVSIDRPMSALCVVKGSDLSILYCPINVPNHPSKFESILYWIYCVCRVNNLEFVPSDISVSLSINWNCFWIWVWSGPSNWYDWQSIIDQVWMERTVLVDCHCFR